MISKKLFQPASRLWCVFFMLFAITASAQQPCTTTSVNNYTPSSGPVGTIVTINGVGFNQGAGTSSVLFNGIQSPGYTTISDTQITAIVPNGATTGTIRVTTNGCVSSGSSFTVLSSACTAILPEVYISELYDHVPGSYGVIELYNPSLTQTINFNGQYILERFGDRLTNLTDPGLTPDYTLTLPGSIAPESTYQILSYGNGVMGCSVATDANMGSGINAEDVIRLKKNGVVIDIAEAPSETGYSVIRKPNAIAPTVAYNESNWNFYSTQSCNDLGSHTADPISPITVITAQPQNAIACVGGQVTFSFTVSMQEGVTYQWKTLNTSGSWVNVVGSVFSGSQTPTLTVNSVSDSLNNSQYYCEITMPGCVLLTNVAVFTVMPQEIIAAIAADPTCTSSGSLTITAPLGAEYQYSVNGGALQASPIFSLGSGSYTITAQNAQGCTSVSTPYIINPAPAAPAVATAIAADPTCTSSGSITITAPLGTEYQYSVNGGAFQASPLFSFGSGSYTITVQNAQGCTSVSTPYVINPAPAAPAVATAIVTDPTCASSGNLTITAPLGTEYQYSVNGGAFQASPLFSLGSGSYIITVQNTQGCTSVSAPYVINPVPAAPAIATAIAADPTCTSSGSLIITAPLGAEYQYSVNGGAFQASPLFSLGSGSYTITVQNAQGCTSVSTPYVINPAPAAPAVATAIVTDPTCTSSGNLTITAPLGSEYQYSVNGGAFQASPLFSLGSGSYTITVQNTQGCTSVSALYVINPTPAAPAIATAIAADPTCTSSGRLTITAPLGAEYQYSVNGGAFQASPIFSLDSGSYTITVQNTQGCTSVSAPYVINPAPAAPSIATAIAADPTCTSSGSLTITAPLGAEYQYSVNGGAFQVSPIFSLGSGSYTITVQNTQGCTSVSTPYIINPAPAAPASATAITADPTCISSGNLTITAPLGTEYQYSVNGGTFQASPLFSLGSGSYTITVQNTQGCTSVSTPYVINVGQTGQPEVSGIQGSQPTINGNNYILEAQVLNNSFNMAQVRFEWKLQGQQAILGDDATFNVTEYSTDNNNSMEDFPLNLELTVITPAGCTGQYLFTVDGIFCDIPRGISPNGDNKNDRFDLTGLNVRHIEIFNRYGMQVYKKANYTNDWYGQSNGGDDLPTGTYYYVINLGNNTKTGWVYINRSN